VLLKTSPNHKKSFLVGAIVLVLGIVLAIDFSARRLYLFFRGTKHGRVAHPVYDHGLRPNTKWIDKYGNLRTPYFVNSFGFRDGHVREVSPASNHPRILLIGDSFCEGIGISWEATFSGQLQKTLASKGIEILNAGVVSYTPTLALAKIKFLWEKRGLRFGRLILFLDMSDIRDELFYQIEEDGRVRPVPYGPFASKAGWGIWVEQFGEFSENSLEPNFVLLGAISRNLKILLRKISKKELGARGALTYLPEFIRYWEKESAPDRAIAAQGIEKIQASLRQLQKYLQERNIPMTLVIYPYPSYAASRRDETQYQKMWKDWARQNQMDLIDLFPEFAGESAQSSLYIPGDSHWNEAGHQRVADALSSRWEAIRPANP